MPHVWSSLFPLCTLYSMSEFHLARWEWCHLKWRPYNCIKRWQQMQVLLDFRANWVEFDYFCNLNQQQETNPKSQNFGDGCWHLIASSYWLNKLRENRSVDGCSCSAFSYFLNWYSDGTLCLINKLLVSPSETNWRCRRSLSESWVGCGSLFVFMMHASRYLNRHVLSLWQRVRTLPMWCTTV